MEDLNTMRLAVSKMLKTEYQRSYEFRVSFSGGAGNIPADFDIFCRSVTYPGIVKIDTDDLRVGSGAVSLPQKKEIGQVSLVYVDDHTGRVTEWLRGMAAKVFNADGTVNLPRDYTLEMSVFIIAPGGAEKEDWKGHVILTDIGDITRSYAEGGLVENTATFIEAEV